MAMTIEIRTAVIDWWVVLNAQFLERTFFNFFPGEIWASSGCPFDNVGEPDPVLKQFAVVVSWHRSGQQAGQKHTLPWKKESKKINRKMHVLMTFWRTIIILQLVLDSRQEKRKYLSWSCHHLVYLKPRLTTLFSRDFGSSTAFDTYKSGCLVRRSGAPWKLHTFQGWYQSENWN